MLILCVGVEQSGLENRLLALGRYLSLCIPSVIDRKYTKSFFHHHGVPTLKASFPYISRAAKHGYTLLNTPRVHPQFPLQGPSRPSVLGIALASSTLIPFFPQWTTDLHTTGSDHVPITVRH